MIPTLSFNGFRFVLAGIGEEAARNAGFHWDFVKQVHWTGLSYVAKNFSQYADYSARRRFEEETARLNKDLQGWPTRHKELLDRFLEITERKVSILDDYGDENWDALAKEIERLLLKTAKLDNDNIDAIKKFVFKGLNEEEIVKAVLPDDQKSEQRLKLLKTGVNHDTVSTVAKKYSFLRSDLEAKFRYHHASQKTIAVATLPDFREMTGVEFETFLARILKEDGYDIAGTPATGDQGADLIIKKSGRTVAVQAKGYKGAVGNSAVQEIVGALRFYGADEGWVITNSVFTAAARELADANGIKLMDGADLRRFLATRTTVPQAPEQTEPIVRFIDRMLRS